MTLNDDRIAFRLGALASGLTVSELAELEDVGQSTISHWVKRYDVASDIDIVSGIRRGSSPEALKRRGEAALNHLVASRLYSEILRCPPETREYAIATAMHEFPEFADNLKSLLSRPTA